MGVSAEDIKKLRDMTSCGIIDCKKALEETKGDFDRAKEVLQKRGLELALKKGNRAAKEGRVESYIHMGSKLSSLVEVNCETDFVAKSPDFCNFVKDVALQIAASSPKYIKRDDVPTDILASQTDPDTFIKENCLMHQVFVKDPKITIQDYLNMVIAKLGENIFVSRFVRYKVGEVD